MGEGDEVMAKPAATPLKAYDWRDDAMGHIIALPEVRARFMRFEPGRQPGGWHSHEESGGVEVFVVLEGAMKFEIDDQTVIATAGQAVVAWPHQKHRATCAGDTPAVIYLTVTPHHPPTHTYYDDSGQIRPNPRPVGTYTWCGDPVPDRVPELG
jgi:quercetin dioxygenase-like cupin family protein